MKVFVSSVRRGLEPERDALPGLILALGHEALRFEDFGAQPVPSREACLRGVAASDVYLLLLGAHYGHVFPETGQSATHDEWVAAVAAGMPRIVFRKLGVDLDPEQEAFSREVGDYGTGVFYGTFTDAVDLQAKVAQALRALEQEPGTLEYGVLPEALSFEWRDEWMSHSNARDQGPCLELHVLPIGAERRSARLMRELPDRVIAGLRSAGALPLKRPRFDAASL